MRVRLFLWGPSTLLRGTVFVFIMRVRMCARLSALCVFVLFAAFLEDLGFTERPLFGQMSEVVHDVPHLFIVQNTLPSRHPGEADSVLHDPAQLTVAIVLHALGFQVGHRR